MIDLGLTSVQLEELKQLLLTHHRVYVRLQLMGLDHSHISDLSPRLLGGQVTIDLTGDTSRVLSVELIDPEHALHIDSNSPNDGSMYLDRMLRATYVVQTLDGLTSYSIPIFTGPIVKLDRTGVIVSLEAQGKERLSMAAIWQGKTFKKGVKKVSAIRFLLQNMAGETQLSLVNRAATLPTPVSANRRTTPWVLATKIARSLNLQLFYDGRGVVRLRPVPSKTTHIFRDNSLLSQPQAGFNTDDMFNAVEVLGGKPKGAKKKLFFRLVAPRPHPLSPWSLGRNGVPRYLPYQVQDDSLRSMKEVKKVAKKTLKQGLLQSVEVTFDMLPMPLLEELDLCRVQTDDFATSFRVSKMTIPLVASGVSTMGYVKLVTPAKNRTRRNRK